ncbi:MAG TPA: AbrB/MazE/SpoVT family DNA-binding domain-containing protein [Candidatus Nanoarchaeia archaeon]|nr:AbrB/MazE/SpoVT family DNA-binding domain-containing protein [Candidatus Nanoarchaeia archaeon]
MSISREELGELISPRHFLERVSTLSSDGKNLLTRFPKEVCEYLGLSKGDKLRFIVTKDRKISLEIITDDAKKKKTDN